ncbi:MULTISPECIES: type II secretion system minor pseudopilin GspH [unclassified Arsukibacterium]|uniref:type II secretion system minor pseudopilin GspH n=1 Tax=unclassified Arsukibacterium TaxID=2635278 RepID=UPI000C3EFC75|nr:MULTISPECIES: type II secretion system minor pseudopilin GspH [unclassified Arsukibacterium]MAA94878.1 type II secretion system protein GspH [Rheinheimera sp.]MBM34681.1 type II secretion system protein GspH [Rheinheimera sp.]HAW92994.1 type II secretion system protein GspH [Candidatus Azambacteria bacterium]|tara:strand:+ start:72938 stop:73525 length:588 start_codon:yes stop_codon:yes gene_type:complete
MAAKPLIRFRQAGFTLLEVMLVLLLIGLLATTVVLNFSGDSPEQRLQKETERFQQVFQFVAETAMLKQQEWGLVLQEGSYSFVYFDGEKWLQADQPKAAELYELAEDIRLQLELEGLPGAELSLLSQLNWQDDDEFTDNASEQPPVLPQVFILSSGEISPFRLMFQLGERLEQVSQTVGTDFTIPLTRSDVITVR